MLEGQPEEEGRAHLGRVRAPPELAPAPPAETPPDGRFRLRFPDPPPAPQMASEGLETPVLPFDSTKTFVGPNGPYYDERWRWMEWRGRNRSWNWAAALTLGGWLAYRRLYALAVVYLGWIGVLVMMLLHHVVLPVTVVAQAGVAIVVGLYGNRLYQASFRRAALEVAQQHDEYAARVAALAGRGGVDPRAAWAWAVAAAGLAGLLVGLER